MWRFQRMVSHVGQQLKHGQVNRFSVLNMVLFSVGIKRELQTLREEIKTLTGQIQKKLKSEFALTSCASLLGLNL